MEHSKVSCSEVKTSFLSRSYVFRWSIENFPKILVTFKLTSHEFKPLNEQNERIFSATLEKQSGDNCILTFNSYPKGNNKYRIDTVFTITVIDNADKVRNRTTYKKPYGECYEDSFDLTYSNKNLIEYSDSSENKTLIFNCVIEFDELATVVHKEELIPSQTDFSPDLLRDLKTMYLDSLHTDLNLMVEDDIMPVHKSVLCARSPVFAKLLSSPMEENSKDEIEIDDIESPILELFIEFLYTGKMPDAEFESVCALYYAADKYDVASLRKACSDVLVAELDVENACRILSLASRHSDKQLKDVVLDYMKFEFEAILGTESFADFVRTETELAMEFMKLRSRKFKKSSSD